MSTARDYEAARQAARQGDPLARAAMADAWQDAPDGSMSPYVTGQCYLFETISLYYVGKVVRQGPGWVVIDRASWVHWTGKKTVLLQYGFDVSKFPTTGGRARPRTEYVGDGWIIHVGSQGAAAGPWRHPLPEGPIQ
jgi:hypothetical protein